jgi:hypothetical protein
LAFCGIKIMRNSSKKRDVMEECSIAIGLPSCLNVTDILKNII